MPDFCSVTDGAEVCQKLEGHSGMCLFQKDYLHLPARRELLAKLAASIAAGLVSREILVTVSEYELEGVAQKSVLLALEILRLCEEAR